MVLPAHPCEVPVKVAGDTRPNVFAFYDHGLLCIHQKLKCYGGPRFYARKAR
jgi:hypothetical protein